MSAIASDILDRLRRIVGPRGFIDEPQAMRPYLVEWRDKYAGASPLVLRPASTQQVADILRLCHESGTKVVPQGGNTSLVGGSIPFERGDEIVLSLSRLNRIRAIDPLNDTITVEAGCVLAAVQAAAEAADRLFPMRIGSEGTCQIGGNLSTNAGGNAVLRYGNTRELTLGLEVVLPDGRVLDLLKGLRKDNTGYDLKQLFIGAEGTLGVITAAVLKLFPRPAVQETALAAVRDADAAIALLAAMKRATGNQVTGFELLPRIGIDYVLRHVPGTQDPMPARHDWHVLMEVSSGRPDDAMRATIEQVLGEAAERGDVLDAVVAGSLGQARALWKIREELSDAQRHEGGSIKCDISVPVSKMPEFIARGSAAIIGLIPGARIVAFGHIGDGNVHFNTSQPVGADKAAFLARWDEVTGLAHDLAHELGGSISAEHGVGRMKRDEIVRYKPAAAIELMRTLKRALDPANILNPGKVVRLD